MDISKELSRQLLDAAPDPSVVVDSDGFVLYVNARVTDVLGYEPEELLGQHMEIMLPERFRAVHPTHRNGYFADPNPRPMGSGLELFALQKNGVEIPVEISLSPVTTPDGPWIFAAMRDVSKQKELERELVDASRAKSRFLAAASHDLRQPIQALNLLNRVARAQTNDSAHTSIIDKQQKSLDSMARLLNSLLDISKLEAGIVKPDISDCAVQEIFESLNAEFEEQARDKGLELVINRCGDVARSDARLLTQILENLISNAIRYTQKGFVRLRCLHRDLFIQIEVLDTGLGISPENLDNIFDEFKQVDQGSRRPEGLGLGLSIVKRTAELLGCSLEVSSTLGEGSAFSVIVPQGDPASLSRTAVEREALPVTVGGRVLIVDDEPAVVDATSMLLRVEGYDVIAAASVDEAIASLSIGMPNLLITDFHLRSGATGFDVIRAIRSEAGTDIPVILVSGDTSDAIKLKEFENTRFLTKPVDADELLAEVCKQISRS